MELVNKYVMEQLESKSVIHSPTGIGIHKIIDRYRHEKGLNVMVIFPKYVLADQYLAMGMEAMCVYSSDNIDQNISRLREYDEVIFMEYQSMGNIAKAMVFDYINRLELMDIRTIVINHGGFNKIQKALGENNTDG